MTRRCRKFSLYCREDVCIATYRRRSGCIARMASARLKLARARWAGRGAPDPSARQGASDFDPASHADFGAATHPGVGGGTHRRRATADRCQVVRSCVSFVCSVVWWFVCCACDLCFVERYTLNWMDTTPRGGYFSDRGRVGSRRECTY